MREFQKITNSVFYPSTFSTVDIIKINKNMLRNLLKISLIKHPSYTIIARCYVPRSREPGIARRMKDFGDDFVENADDPEAVVS